MGSSDSQDTQYCGDSDEALDEDGNSFEHSNVNFFSPICSYILFLFLIDKIVFRHRCPNESYGVHQGCAEKGPRKHEGKVQKIPYACS